MEKKIKNLKRIGVISIILVILISLYASLFTKSLAVSNETKIVLGDNEITVDGEKISEDISREYICY